METKDKLKIKGIKQEMSQIFDDAGIVTPVTRVSVSEGLTEELLSKAVLVKGVSKGKGFTGGMKKWNFKGQMATRGQSTKPRAPGSVGGQTPGRVLKGKKMAGRHGSYNVTISGLKIVKVDVAKNDVFVSGPIPGARNSKIVIVVL